MNPVDEQLATLILNTVITNSPPGTSPQQILEALVDITVVQLVTITPVDDDLIMKAVVEVLARFRELVMLNVEIKRQILARAN